MPSEIFTWTSGGSFWVKSIANCCRLMRPSASISSFCESACAALPAGVPGASGVEERRESWLNLVVSRVNVDLFFVMPDGFADKNFGGHQHGFAFAGFRVAVDQLLQLRLQVVHHRNVGAEIGDLFFKGRHQ